MYIECLDGCCKLFLSNKNIKEPKEYLEDNKYKKKSGIFILDYKNSDEMRILVTQSYNMFWSIPKGTKEPDENIETTSLRETFEETGVDLKTTCNIKTCPRFVYKIHKNSYTVYTVEFERAGPECTQTPEILNNETTGCGWIKISCLYKLYIDKRVVLNLLTRTILQKNTNLNWFKMSKKTKNKL